MCKDWSHERQTLFSLAGVLCACWSGWRCALCFQFNLVCRRLGKTASQAIGRQQETQVCRCQSSLFSQGPGLAGYLRDCCACVRKGSAHASPHAWAFRLTIPAQGFTAFLHGQSQVRRYLFIFSSRKPTTGTTQQASCPERCHGSKS